MMRGASRLVARSVPLPTHGCGIAATATAAQRHFSSNYSDDLGQHKRPYVTESRSGAHRHPPRREVMREQRLAAAAAAAAAASAAKSDHVQDADEEAGMPVPSRSPKTHYPEYHKKKADERLAFTSSFREPDMKPILEAANSKPQPPSSHRAGGAAADLDDTDVTRIYSKEEVRSMAHGAKQPGAVVPAATDDVLEALSKEDAVEEADSLNADDNDDADEFAEIRSHPFFMDMLRRVERNMIRFRKETRSLGRYSVEAVNECVRPLLQLTDYPLTATQLSHLSHSISPAVLKSSLRDRAACRRLQLYRSQDTDLLLDWSTEDFLRRRYESVHLSWEPMDVICRRFGWTPEMLSDRDLLLYFSAFPDYVEMAELQKTGSGEPKAIPIHDPVARAAEGAIPASSLLLRRTATVDAEPSLTESIRLMGNPAVSTPAKGRKAQRMRQHGGDSVTDYFSAVETAAAEVEGEEAVRLQHAADTVPPLRQASHPGGRTVREFSLPKSHAAPSGSVSSAAAPVAAAAAASPAGAEATFDQRKFEEVSNAYHNAKVENSLLRRRLLGTDSVDKTQGLQAELAKGRSEVLQLEQELERMRELKRHTAAAGAAATPGFHVPRGLPHYAEAPEFDRPVKSKNESAVEDNDDDEIAQALKDYKEEEELEMHGKAVPASAKATTRAAPTAAADEDEYEEVEVEMEVDDEDGDLTAAEEVAAETQAETELDVVAEEAVEADSFEAPLAEEEETPAAATKVMRAASKQQYPVSHDQQWQDELEAAVEQQEAELEEGEEDFSAALANTNTATTPSLRLEQLTSLHDRLSSAADRARRYLTTVESRRMEVLEKLDSQLADANKKVGNLEAQLTSVEEEQLALKEAMVREEAEQKAHEMEAQLEAQRARRMAELEQQREQARLAQAAAARAVERQKAAEREALAMEEELQQKLRDVQSRLRSLKEEDAEPHAAPTPAAPVGKARAPAPASAKAVEVAEEEEDETVSATPVSAGQFMCTPEQYDGLYLAADRLKKEIAALEAQMEGEGDEDDETLMAVLAASRADLEELEECVASVQANAAWAAARDAKRAKESTLSAQVTDTEAHRLQSAIDNHRFQISLLEKRMHHASSKTIAAKLKDRIAQARRSISQLRHEQDQLRRAGRDALGLPASVSIAETLAHEGKEPEEAKIADERHTAVASAKEATLDASAEGEEEEESTDAAEDTAEGETEDLRAGGKADEKEAAGAAASAATVSDADKLRVRLDSMVGDIQHLQDSIEAQERSSDYDDGETEEVLREMKGKLSQLLQLRDQVQRALVEEFVNEPASPSGPTPVIRPTSGAAPAAGAAAASTGVMGGRAATAVRNAPASSAAFKHGARISSASKKLRGASRSRVAHRRR